MARLPVIAPSRRNLTPTPQVQPASAEPLAVGFTNLGNALDQFAESRDAIKAAGIDLETAEHERKRFDKNRKQKIDRANALIGFARARGEYERQLIDLSNDAAIDGSDYVERSEELLQSTMGEFLNSIGDPELRREFAPNVETFTQGQRTGNYATQLERQANYYTGAADELLQSAVDTIQSGAKAYEDWAPIFEDYFASSPLPAAETEVLRDTVLQRLQEADFARQAITESTEYESIRGSHISGNPNGQIAAAGLPGHITGLLEAIGGVESGLRYDILFSPEGTRTFDDFSWHPNKPANIPAGMPHAGETSSAAGAFQFIAGTWERAAAALGLEDFSPENQVRAAVWLAKDDYRRTTGRDLDLDLASGDPSSVALVHETLKSTWTGLRNLSHAEFYAQVTGGQPTPTGLVDDPMYADVSYSRKMELIELAQERRKDNIVAGIQRQNATVEASLLDLQGQIRAGQVTGPMLDRIAANSAWTAEQEKGIYSFYRTEQEQQHRAEQFTENLADGTYVFGAADKDEADAFFAREQRDIFTDLDHERMFNEFIPTVERTGLLPTEAGTMLEEMRLSDDRNKAEFALAALGRLATSERNTAGLLSEEAAADALYYNNVAGVYKPNQVVLEELRTANSPELQQARAASMDRIELARKDHPRDFSASSIAAAVDPALTVRDPDLADGTAMALEADFLRLYEQEFYRYQDHGRASEAVHELMRREWGMTEVGGESIFTRLPVEKVYPEYLGNHNYIDKQVREDLGLGREAPYQLISDNQTRFEQQRQSAPSFMVKMYTEEGLPFLALEDDGSPTRLSFQSPTQRMVEEDGTVRVDEVTARVEAGTWVRDFRELRSTVRNSEIISQMGVLSPNERAEYIHNVLTTEQLNELLELNRQSRELFESAPEGYEQYTQELSGSIAEIKELLSLPEAPQ